MSVCIKYQEMINAKIDGEIDAKDLQTIDKHLLSCNECKKLETDLLKIKNLVNIQPKFKLSDGFNSKLMERIKNEKREKRKGRSISLRSVMTYVAGVAAVFVSFLVINSNDMEKSAVSNSFLTDQNSQIYLNSNDSTFLDSLKSTDQIKNHELKTYQVSDEE
ncbi:MAG: hypothetical protein CR982_02230 [Candidatus Cloacimonadota bacterium]|nr:MAG: hypothetical protein CR982_02230 [Candidatus Cloacimonadota bacterium]PIE81111.1 MAG: hypothetical protein CSA15_01160 [Candidatus Delongbacteria bacterium]